MTGFMVGAAMAPFGSALKPKRAKPRKAAVAKVPTALAKLKTKIARADAAAPSSGLADGAQMLSRVHRSATGSRSFKLFLPSSNPARPKGLILMLHGCSQSPDDFAVGTHMNVLAEKHGLAVAWPAQTRTHNAALCWNWFKPGNQERGAGEPALLAALTRKLMKELHLQRDDVFVAGLSAGGAMAAILVDVYPDVFSAAGVHSGLARGSAGDVMSAMSAMRSGGKPDSALAAKAQTAFPVRRIIFQGEADSTVHPSNAEKIVAMALGEAAVPAKTGNRSVRGRGYSRSDFTGPDGAVALELWMLEGAGHAWSGGRSGGSYTDVKGPDASAQMIRFFLAKPA